MTQSLEIELLLLCARPRADSAAVQNMLELLAAPPDWSLLFELADQYRMTPLLARHLHEHAPHLLSDEVQAELQAHHLETTRHNLVLAAELLRLSETLSAEHIPLVAFKGPVSAILAYGDMAMRACGDIDLLVKAADHGRAEQRLVQEGYRVAQRYPDAMQSTLWHEQRAISVDLHWGIPPARLRLRSELLWENLQPVTLLGRSVSGFSRRDTLLVIAVNAVKEYWKPSLHQLSEVAALTVDYTDDEWLQAFRRARAIGCRRALAVALLLAHRLLDAPLPSVGPLHLFNYGSVKAAVDELAEHLFPTADTDTGEPPMQLSHFPHTLTWYAALTDSPWQRARAWIEWAGTPNRADADFVRLPGRLSLLYFLVRPLRLLLKRL